MEVFATRSPFRPNPIGLSSVELTGVDWDTPRGPVLHVVGADLLNGTPILDIKPYLAYTDAHPDARCGFALTETPLQVSCPEALLGRFPADKQKGLLSALAQDPRPAYQDDPKRVYNMSFGGYNVSFAVEGDVLTVHGVVAEEKQ